MNIFKSILVFIAIALLCSCKSDTKWKGQEIIKKVSTQSVPIQLQYKGIFNLKNGVYISNDFSGARLNGAVLSNDSLVSVLITPENEPINMSPWYSFKIWSEAKKNISLKLTYSKDASHRYYPKLSNDGVVWKNIDSTNYTAVSKNNEAPKEAIIKIEVSSDTLWVSAQELINTTHVNLWESRLNNNPFVKKTEIGKSSEGRSINTLRISNTDDKKMIVIFSRQHPPEVTGYLAMQEFVNTICEDTELSKKFRSQYTTYVIPNINPDGVDNGHWRHNKGGVDLNRDWKDFNQPETSAIRDFLNNTLKKSGGKYLFSIDFHSTWQDIFYTIDPKAESNMSGFIPIWLNEVKKEFNEYEPNIRSIPDTIGISSSTYMFYKHKAESLTYEVGDNTDREFVRLKGKVAAQKLMELMLK